MEGLGEAIGMLLALPFVAVTEWLTWIERQQPGQQELAKACHGAGILALLGYWLALTGGLGDFLRGLLLRPAAPLHWVPVALAAWGLAWFLLYARFAAQAVGRPHRAAMIVRAVVKIAIGAAAWIGADSPAITARGGVFLVLAFHAFAVWCLATGGVKALLMIWGGGRGLAHPLVARDIAANEFDWDDGRIP